MASTCTYAFTGNVLSANLTLSGAINVTEVSANQAVVQGAETNGYNATLLVGDNTSINTQTSKGVHIGYDNVGNKGSIYSMNGSASLTDLYLNDPTYNLVSTTSIHMPNVLTKSISSGITGGDLTLSGNGSGKVIISSDISTASNLIIPATTASVGHIVQNSQVILQRYGTNNNFIGANSGNYTLTGNSNTALGDSTMASLSSGSSNVAIGTNSMSNAVVTGSGNHGIGVQTLNNLTSGSSNIGVGQATLSALTTGNFNVAIGHNSMNLTTTGSSNIGIGEFTLGGAAVTGGGNIAVGGSSLNLVTSGAGNVGIGAPTMRNLTTGSYNVAIGYLAMDLGVTTGNNNIAIGQRALNAVTSGTNNIAIGQDAMKISTSGSSNIAIGFSSMSVNVISGANNIGLGLGSLQKVSSGGANLAVGTNALVNVTSGNANMSLGPSTLTALTTGSNNIAIGNGAGSAMTSSESANILIGNAQVGVIGESNAIRIGNSSTKCFIQGINSVSLGASANIMAIISGDQLGTAATTLTSGASNLNTNGGYYVNSGLVRDATASYFNNGSATATLNNTGAAANCTYSFPNKTLGSYTVATTSDIPDVTTGLLGLPTNTKIVYVSPNGNDSTGNGTFAKPYALPSAAMASITGSGSANRFVIYCSAGIYGTSATTILFKPYVYICPANPFSCRIQENLGVDSSMLTGNARSGAFGVLFSGSTAATFDFTTDSTHSHIMEFSNCQFNVPFTFRSAGVADFLSLYTCNIFQAMTVSGAATSMVSCIHQAALTIDTASGGSATASFQGTQFNNGNVVLTSTGALTNAAQFMGSIIISPYTLTLNNVTPGNTTYQFDSTSRIQVARATLGTGTVSALAEVNPFVISGAPVVTTISVDAYIFRYPGKLKAPFTKAYIMAANSANTSVVSLYDITSGSPVQLATCNLVGNIFDVVDMGTISNVLNSAGIYTLTVDSVGAGSTVKIYSLSLE